MRVRLAVLASVAATLVAIAVPSIGSAAPSSNNGLTINVTPNPILAGEGVLIYGQLNVSPIQGQKIILYHHVAGSFRGYTRVSETKTDSHGFYKFPRAENVVTTNRNWFVREADHPGVHSRIIRERVAALVSLDANTDSTDTNHAISFTGHVSPNHAFERVFLQQQIGSSDDWRTLKSGGLSPGSNYRISYRWRRPGEHNVRVVFPGDFRNTRGASDPLSVTIEQAQVPDFTISSSSPIITEGQSATLTGVLKKPDGSGPEPSTAVTLYAWTNSVPFFTPVQHMTTGSDGGYKFTVSPTENTIYQVRTTLAPHRDSAVLFEGVRDVVTMTSSSSTSTVGQTVTMNGTVSPNKAGHVIYLQRLGSDGDWHTVHVGHVASDSSFQFFWTFGKAGTYRFRARITGDSKNVGGASPPVKITVSPPTSVSTLPTTS